MKNLILLFSLFTAAITINCNAQVKYININISEPNLEDCISGIENTFKDCDFVIFPNPSRGVFTIEINNSTKEKKADLFVYDISGKEIMRDVLWVNKKLTFSLDLSKNNKGIYILKINDKDNNTYKASLIIN